MQHTLRSSLTVFQVKQTTNFFEIIGKVELIPEIEKNVQLSTVDAVLERILQLDPTEFEILIKHLLTAMGFEEAEHRGKTGVGGVDVYGELNVGNLAKTKLFVQAKRYRRDAKIGVCER